MGRRTLLPPRMRRSPCLTQGAEAEKRTEGGGVDDKESSIGSRRRRAATAIDRAENLVHVRKTGANQ